MFRTATVRCLMMSICALSLCAPAVVLAQSTELLRAYQNLEAAKSANKADEAFKYGDQAVKLNEAAGDKQSLAELERGLGDFAVQTGDDARAQQYYERALAVQESLLGPQHPDLVPILTSLVDLNMRAKRYAAAATFDERVLGIERQVYGEHHENVLATLKKLHDIYAAANDSAGLARIDAQAKAAAQPPPPAQTRGLPPPGGLAGNRHYKQDHGFANVRVFYGTNRAPTGSAKPALFYGPGRGELQYGYLNVTIPQIHKEAELETQGRWSEIDLLLTDAGLRQRYVLLDQVTPLPKDAFVKALRQQITSSPSKDLFIFVHGFNNSFEDAARRAAQMAYDLDFDGTPVLYSWPSAANPAAYAVDEAAVGISGRKMAEFLDTIVTQSGAARIHILAHSMGNRALIEALQTFLAKRSPDKREHIFGQIVFTAPDVDRDYFVDAIDSLRSSAERVTLYASVNDYALRSSQFLHGAPRAGTAGDAIVKLPGLDTIDMSSVPADALGHSYFAANSGAIYDVFRILWRGDPPPQRCGMSTRKGAATLTVWTFNADACKGDDLLEAGVMLKRFGDLAHEHVVNNIATLTDPSQKKEWGLILNRLDTLLAPAPGTAAGK